MQDTSAAPRRGIVVSDAPDHPEHGWHALEAFEVVERLGVDSASGLHPADAAARLAAHGRNELTEAPRRARWRLLADQFRNVLIVVLIGARGARRAGR